MQGPRFAPLCLAQLLHRNAAAWTLEGALICAYLRLHLICSDTPDLLLSWAATRAQQDKLAAAEASGIAGSSTPATSSIGPGLEAAGGSSRAAVGAGGSAGAGGTAAALAPHAGGLQTSQEAADQHSIDQRSRSHATKAFLSPWELQFSALQFVRPLGSGSYGQVTAAGSSVC